MKPVQFRVAGRMLAAVALIGAAESAAYTRAELTRWERVVRRANIQPE